MKTKILCLALALVTTATAAFAVDAPYKPFGVDLSARDLGTRPGDDFWRYANGAWAERTAFPPDREATGVAGDLSQRAGSEVEHIVATLATGTRAGTTERKIGDMYAAWIETDGIEQRGLAPLQPYLATIHAIHDRDSLVRVMATPGFASPVIVGSMVDFRAPTSYLAYVGQGELGMQRENYLLAGPKYDAWRAAYRVYVARVLELAGAGHSPAVVDAIIGLETRMAKASWSLEDTRDPAKGAHVETVQALQAKAPGVNWPLMLARAGLKANAPVAMTQDTAVVALAHIIADTPLDTWKDYLVFRFASDHADALPKAFGEAHFAFYSTTLYGLQAAPARAASGVALVNKTMADGVGQVYLKTHFSDRARKQVMELVEDLRAAYGDLIRQSSWMDEPTRAAALAKLQAMKANIGGPDAVVDYASLRVDRSDPLGNLVRSAGFERATDLARVGRPVDRSAWVTSPQLANGFYDPSTNQIYFAAALLQPPLLDPDADAAVNYGAMGAFIGHEIGHAFDDQGAHYGPDGTLKDWWSAESKKRFDVRAAAIAAQYGAEEALPGLHVNGTLTLGEDMADLSGLEAAFLAYRKYQARHGVAPVLDGLSGDQRFFLSNAQLRRTKVREATLRQLVLFDTHAPSKVRLNSAVRNMDAWYAAFSVQPDNKLYLAPASRLHLW